MWETKIENKLFARPGFYKVKYLYYYVGANNALIFLKTHSMLISLGLRRRFCPGFLCDLDRWDSNQAIGLQCSILCSDFSMLWCGLKIKREYIFKPLVLKKLCNEDMEKTASKGCSQRSTQSLKSSINIGNQKSQYGYY